MATAFHVEVVTPERVLFAGDVEEVSMRTDGGEISFLAHHEDYVGAADISVVRLDVAAGGADDAPAPVTLALHGGFVHVRSGAMTILASTAELGAEIDVERARRDLAAAEARFAEEGPARRDGEEPGEEPTHRLAGAMVALLAPDSAEAAVARARARIAAAEATG